MARIAFILLCHKDPEAVIAQAEQLTATGDYVSIHFDGRAPDAVFARIHEALSPNPSVAFAQRRIKCGWGEWSLVAATIEAIRAALAAFPRASHFYMLSGDCMPAKSAAYAHAFLDREDADFIESVDFYESGWIKTGMVEDRLIYRHFFNERNSKWLFYKSLNAQRALGLSRQVPEDIEMMIGSQWWCLRRRTVEAIMDFIAERRDVMRFFSTTWIPDETFFQTLVRHLVPDAEIRSRSLTFLMFSDYGMPVVFYDDQFDLLLGQDCLFARKISPEATELKERLGAVWTSDRTDFPISGEGRRLFQFLTGRGRIGRRFAPRFWERGATIGRGRTLLVVVCKKWHVAKRLMARIRQVTGIPCIDYLFDEESTALPDMGGIERSLGKRTRHRRAMVRLLFEMNDTDMLGICLDPSRIDLIEDFDDDTVRLRVLEMDCTFSDDYLRGHVQRIGLAAEGSPGEVIDRLMPTVRFELDFESTRLREADLESFGVMGQEISDEENAQVLARFLGVDEAQAREIAATHYLFSD